ncbi:DUF1810 domain-containing protein [Sphingomonas sp. TDK1]|uniref:DUF1810 domain-containing protein n=1 Tax=Sphingomonas sp. TDK1 TaxID=453247 RepID=UPI0007D9D663|nr:DUF1810 domain-containing protein [Sphingomonas sp. TDK1]OAN58111.1 calpastatin [Sphingomonas sp. TDK1]
MDPLDRFVAAQATDFAVARAELQRGRKTSHWIWYIFPQIAGLGRSDMAQRYAIADLEEARAYLAHPLLGPRLRDLTRTLLAHAGKRRAEAILGDIDAMKVRSSMTLFEAADIEPDGIFAACLDAFYAGSRDPETLRRITC